MNKTKISAFSIILFLIFCFSCAQIGNLTGGDKDEIPPKILGSNPAEKTTNFEGKKITIVFDEYFQLNNLEGVFLSSPLLKEKPKFKIKKRSLLVKFDEKLLDTTTYTFSFGNAIADFHENNPIINYKFVISTGNIVDSFAISGSVRDAFSHQSEKEMFVMLYRAYSDSTPIKKTPYYISQTDTAGKFEFDYIKPGNYRIFALNDLDANYFFNLPNEKIAYTDTFIIPEIEKNIKIDRLKAGTILHNLQDSTIIDTLKTDSLIITEKNIYLPENVHLFSFMEDKKRQYIKKANRPLSGQCIFEYSKEIDSLMISFLKPEIEMKNILIEKTDTGKIVTYWLKDSLIYNKDTLDFTVNFYNKDSTENLILETDTFNLVYEKKADSLMEKYTDLNLKESDHDYFKDFVIESKTPILKFDTSKIKLYEVIDTMVFDPKIQKLLKAQRQNFDKISFEFKRPVVKDFDLKLLNFPKRKNWYTEKFNKEQNKIECKITDKEILKSDTIKLIVHYDNDFFLNQIQQFYDTINLQLVKQKILSVERKTPDTIKINFEKSVNQDFEIFVLDKNYKNWYRKINSEDKSNIILKIINRNIKEIDSLEFSVKVSDYTDSLNNKIFFTDTISAFFIKKEKVEKKKKRKAVKVKASIDFPVKYEIKKDSSEFRKFNISHKWKGNNFYAVKIDSTAFIDIFNLYNKNSEIRFKVRDEKFYGKILLNISNLKSIGEKDFFTKKVNKINDSLNVDSVAKLKKITADSIANSVLEKGKIIILLSDNKSGEILQKKFIKNDANLIFDKLQPGDYKLKLIYDKNENNKWDTGDYLKNIKPERVLIYKQTINVRSNWISETDWKIKFE